MFSVASKEKFEKIKNELDTYYGSQGLKKIDSQDYYNKEVIYPKIRQTSIIDKK